MLRVLTDAKQLGTQPHVGAVRLRGVEQQRLQQVLRGIAHAARARELVIAVPHGARAPGHHPRDLLACKARCIDLRAHQLLRHRHGDQLVLDPEIPEDLDSPLVGDVRSRRVGRSVVLRDRDGVHLEPRQQCGSGQAGRTGANDEDVGIDDVHGRVPPGAGGSGVWACSRIVPGLFFEAGLPFFEPILYVRKVLRRDSSRQRRIGKGAVLNLQRRFARSSLYFTNVQFL